MFAGAGNGANAFDAPGRNQFNNVVVNSGVNTDLSSKSDAQILVRGDWTMDGTAEPDRQEHQGHVQREWRADHRRRPADHLPQSVCGQDGRQPVTLARSALVTNGDVIVVSGTLDLATFTLNRSAPRRGNSGS